MKLTKMTQEEYDRWAPRSRAEYAQDKMKANRLTQAEAEEIAERDFHRLLPDGLNSKDNYLFTMKDPQAAQVGYIWFCVRGASDNRKAFVCDIVVEENHRGKGYGKAAMLLVEEEAKQIGLKEIGLHVFGFNKTAIGLYQSLGYQTTDLVMAKTLT